MAAVLGILSPKNLPGKTGMVDTFLKLAERESYPFSTRPLTTFPVSLEAPGLKEA